MLLSAAPVLINYGYDNNISLQGQTVYTFDNLDFTSNSVLASAHDVTLNNNQLVVLTRNLYLPEVLEPRDPIAAPKTYVFNSIITNNYGAYLYATDPTDTAGSTLSFTSNILSATVFNFYFPAISSNNVQVYYTAASGTGTVDLYLTCNTVASIISAGQNTSLTEADYTFFYILSGNSLSLITITPGAFGYFIGNDGSSLTYNSVVPTAPNVVSIPSTCIFKASRFLDDNQNGEIESYGESNLVKYYKANNSISVEKRTQKTTFNYLITAPYKSISAADEGGVDLDVNIAPLKNYYGPRENQAIIGTVNPPPLRTYNKIFTGLNQNIGFDKIYLGFSSSIADIGFIKDTNTYFHIPYGTTSIALSSTDLIQYGAYPGTTPYRSDRIFKKNANYKNYSNWGDSSGSYYPLTGTGTSIQNGTYLCTWLSAGANADITPVWVDRFFDPRYVNIKGVDWTTINALSAFLSYSTNNYPNVIWDTPSNLVFEPGVLYYYHRIGDVDNTTLVQSFSGLTHHFNSWGPILYNKVTGLSAGVIESFTAANSGIDPNARSPYYLPDETYGVINTNNSNFVGNKGNTLSFYSYQKDWNYIQGDQIVGNYFNGGIGVFNNIGLNTPYFTIGSVTDATTTSAGTIRTYNNDLALLNYETYTTFLTATNDPLSASNFILRGNYDESYYVIDGHSTDKYISTFDPDDLITSKTSLVSFAPTLSSEYILDASLHLDTTLNSKFIVIKTRPTPTSVTYRKFLTNGILVSASTTTSYNNFAVNFEGNPVFYNSKTQGVSALSGTNSCVDSHGLVFALSSTGSTDFLTRNDTGILTVTKPGYINCDHENNIWITYNDTSLAKVTRDGEVLWTKQVNINENITNYSGVRTINFIADVNTSGVTYYALLLDAKTNYVYKIDMDGNIITKQAVTNIIPFGDATGFNYQRMYVKPYVTESSIKLKTVSVDSTLTVPVPKYTTLTYCVSGLASGWHHFAATYDENNTVKLYIDGEVVKESSFTVHPNYNVTGKFLYRLFNYKNNPQLLLGTSSFKTGTLNSWLEQPNKYMYNGRLADVRLYNITLTPSDIKSLSKNYLYNQFNDLHWALTVGTRDYIDEIERFFIHRLPGSKSQFYNIRIKQSGIVNPTVKAIVENNLRAAALKAGPAYTRLRSIIWE